ncbi:Methyl-CpG DNA-binding [Sesbania bispinosa]|nr:Methyl-CpG DNA-binding [Sesbania bispinosa]
METQRGEKSNAKGKRNNVTNTFSPMTNSTVSKIKRKRTRSEAKPLCTIHDNTSPGYGWLLPGWVGEERHMESGRVYRYYYDPDGNLYKSKAEVLATLEAAGMVVIPD